MNNIKMIALDLDGTLMGHGYTISKANIDAIQNCLNQGVHVYLVTGRPYSFTKMIANKIDSRVEIIAANGGYYEINGKCTEFPISNKAINQIVDYAHSDHIQLFMKGKHDYFCNVPYDKRFLYDHMNEQFPNSAKVRTFTNLSDEEMKNLTHDILKVLVFHEDVDVMNRYRHKLQELNMITITDYRPISFDITAKGIDKGTTLNQILKEKNLNSEQLMACGDSNNDLAMFKAAGLKIAMSNASDEIKSLCDDVLDNSENEGVSKSIYKYVLRK